MEEELKKLQAQSQGGQQGQRSGQSAQDRGQGNSGASALACAVEP